MKTDILIYHILVSLLSVFIATETIAGNEATEAGNEKVYVGAILPLSGEVASWGEAVRNGLMLGLEKLPENIRQRIEINFEDDGLSPKNSISAFHKLKREGKLDIMLNMSSGTGLALAPLAEQARIPFIAIGASDKKVSEGREYSFNFWVTPEEEAKTAIPEIVKRQYKKIARIITVHDGAIAIKEAFDRENKEHVKIVVDEEYISGVKDFRTFIAKVRSRGDVDAIMLILLPGQGGVFSKQAREMGLSQDLFGFEMFEDLNEVKQSANTLVGQWYVNADDASEDFFNVYKTRFPNASFLGATNGHDAILLIGASLEKGYDTKNFHEFLATLKDFKGALGTYSATGDNRFTLPAAVKIVTKDGFEKLYK